MKNKEMKMKFIQRTVITLIALLTFSTVSAASETILDRILKSHGF